MKEKGLELVHRPLNSALDEGRRDLLRTRSNSSTRLLQNGGFEKERGVIVLRSTGVPDLITESALYRYIDDKDFRKRIDGFMGSNDQSEFPRFVVSLAYYGIGRYTYMWRREIIAKFNPITKDNGTMVINCNGEAKLAFRNLSTPFM